MSLYKSPKNAIGNKPMPLEGAGLRPGVLNAIGDTPVGVYGPPPEPSYILKVTYLDATTTFYVEGTETSVTQANGNAAVNNANHTQIDSISFGSQVTSIGANAFDGGANTKWQTFTGIVGSLANITSIGASAFSNWWAFNRAFTVPASVTSIGASAFSTWKAYTHNFTFASSAPTSVTYSNATMFNNWKTYRAATIVTGGGSEQDWRDELWLSRNNGDLVTVNGKEYGALGSTTFKEVNTSSYPAALADWDNFIDTPTKALSGSNLSVTKAGDYAVAKYNKAAAYTKVNKIVCSIAHSGSLTYPYLTPWYETEARRFLIAYTNATGAVQVQMWDDGATNFPVILASMANPTTMRSLEASILINGTSAEVTVKAYNGSAALIGQVTSTVTNVFDSTWAAKPSVVTYGGTTVSTKWRMEGTGMEYTL